MKTATSAARERTNAFFVSPAAEKEASALVGTVGSWSTSMTISSETYLDSSFMFLMMERMVRYVFSGVSEVTVKVIRFVPLMTLALALA